MILTHRRYLHGHTLHTQAAVQTRLCSNLIILALEISLAPKITPSFWGLLLLLLKSVATSSSPQLPHLNCLQEHWAYHQRFFFCVGPAAGMIRTALSSAGDSTFN